MTDDGQLKGMTFQVAKVSKPLGAVSRICDAGHTVVFKAGAGCIINDATGEQTWLRRENGVYVLDAWVAPPQCVQELQASTFGGHGKPGK